MSYWGQQVNNAAAAFFGSEYLRDYTHAAKTFRPNGYQYSPKFKFLFHVYFDINQSAYPVGLGTGANFGLAVKTVRLPSYKFDTTTLNQYNRKRIIQTKLKYDPIDITFHDDNGNLIRNLLYYYMLYYYNDSNKPYVEKAGPTLNPSPTQPILNQQGTLAINNATTSLSYNYRNIYNPSITGDVDWGYIGEGSQPSSVTEAAIGTTKIPFFKNITVYGFNQHNYVAYTLINPIITSLAHDTYSYAESSGTMEHNIQLEYETVKYYQGALQGSNPENAVPGFGSGQNYDKTLSPLAKPGSQNRILGQGGLVDAAGGTLQDLANGNFIGAIQKAGTAYNTFKNTNLKQTALNEINVGLQNATNINQPNRNLNFAFPVFGATPNRVGTAGAPNGSIYSPPTINTGGQ